MPQTGLKSLKAYFSAETLADLERHLAWLRRLQEAWCERVQAPLSNHSRPASYRSGRLSVYATSSLWANRLRHQRVRLIQALRQHPVFEGLAEITVRVAPSEKSAARMVTRADKPRHQRSHNAGVLLRAVAEEIEDPDLRAALHKLGTIVGKTR